MAQTGFTPIQIYSSSTAAATPSAGNLTNSTLGSELAINITDGKLFYKDNANAVQVIGWKVVPTSAGGTGLTSFTANQVFYASSTSAIGQSANLTFNGTTLTANDITDSSLTSGRVTYAGTGGNLVDSANLTFNGTTLTTTGINNTGNTTLGDASTDTVTVNGYMGVGGAGNVDNILRITGSGSFAGANQSGGVFFPTGTTSGTSEVAAVLGVVQTAASAYTVTNVVGLKANNAVKGAGSTITNQHGLYVADQTQGTNNYGITSLVSSGTNKWNIYASGTAANYFAGTTLIGTTASNGVGGASGSGTLQVETANAASNISVARNTNNSTPPYFFFGKSRGAALGGRTIVASGDSLGQMIFSGTDGTDYIQAASIVAQVDGTPGTNDMPGRLIFSTTADGASSTTERMRINNAGITQFNSNLVMPYQGAPTSKAALATLTGAELITGILNTTGTTYTITLPTGTDIEGALSWSANNVALDWWVINTASGTITIGANGNTTLGTLTIATGVSAYFRIRRTALNTFTVYRLS
jgi:hypothetical protein